ncbi:MAG: hypothetical protein RLZZ373_1246 [Pseudomonadota bacterium]
MATGTGVGSTTLATGFTGATATGAGATGADTGAATGTGTGAGAATTAAGGATDAGTGAGAALPKKRRIRPPSPPLGAGAGIGADTCRTATGAGLSVHADGSATIGTDAGAGAGTTGTGGATGAGNGAGRGAWAGSAAGLFQRRVRSSAAAASKAAGVTGFCTQIAEATSWDWVDSAIPGPPRRPCHASQCWRDSSVSKSKMATSAESSVEGAKLLRPVLEKKKSSTAWVRGGKERRTTFNRVCSLVASTDYRLKVKDRSAGMTAWNVRGRFKTNPTAAHRGAPRASRPYRPCLRHLGCAGRWPATRG